METKFLKISYIEEGKLERNEIIHYININHIIDISGLFDNTNGKYFTITTNNKLFHVDEEHYSEIIDKLTII